MYKEVIIMLIAEQLFLLTTNPSTGKPYMSSTLMHCLSASLISELLLNGNLELNKKKVSLIQSESTDPLLQETLTLIANKPNRSIDYWVTQLLTSHKNLHNKIGDKLSDRGVVSKQEKKILGLFPSVAFPFEKGDLSDVVRDTFNIVLSKKQSQTELNSHEEKTIVLMSLLQGSGLIKNVYDNRSEARFVEKEIKRITKDLPVTQAVKKSDGRCSTRSYCRCNYGKCSCIIRLILFF